MNSAFSQYINFIRNIIFRWYVDTEKKRDKSHLVETSSYFVFYAKSLLPVLSCPPWTGRKGSGFNDFNIRVF